MQIPVTKIRRVSASSLSGGRNDAIRGRESQFNRDMKREFARQYQEAMKREVWRTGDYGWLKGEAEELNLVNASIGHISYFNQQGAKAGMKRVGIRIPDYIERPQVHEAIKREAYLFARSAGQSSVESLRLQMLEAHENGETVIEMRNRIKTVFGFDYDANEYVPIGSEDAEDLENWRAERIARTESANASTVGERKAWQISTVVEKVEWSPSADACPFCLSMRGVTSEIDKPFFALGSSLDVMWNGKILTMQFGYREVFGPPLHPNCRCGQLAVLS